MLHDLGRLGTKSYKNTDNGYGVSLWNTGLLEAPDAAVSPKRFQWETILTTYINQETKN